MQPLDPAKNYTDAEVVDALTGRYGTRTWSYRYDRLDELNNYIGDIPDIVEGSVANNALADVKRTAKFTVLDSGNINYLKDRIRPWARMTMPRRAGDTRRGYVEWPLGVFLLATPTRSRGTGGHVRRQVEAYDQLVVLNDDPVTDRYVVPAGTLYTTAIATIAFGFASAIVPSTLALPGAMEWEPGTTKLRILNDLLSAINYESAWFDEQGRLICRPYQSPAVRTSEYSYATDARSVISGNVEQTLDLFSVPNKFVVIKSEADQPALVGVYTNTSPTSPTSTVSRGRTITRFYEEDVAADQATINAKAARYAFEASQVFENVKFATLGMPMHSNADVYTLTVGSLGMADKYSEHEWELPLMAGAAMTHTVRRVVTL